MLLSSTSNKGNDALLHRAGRSNAFTALTVGSCHIKTITFHILAAGLNSVLSSQRQQRELSSVKMSPIIIFRVSAARNHNGTQREVPSGSQLCADIDGASASARSTAGWRQKRRVRTVLDKDREQSPPVT